MTDKLTAHILNFYEDLDLPLGELYEVVDAIAAGELEDVTEKMDGQNLTFTVISGQVQIFSKGITWSRAQAGGVSRADIVVKYASKPKVRDAYLTAVDALQAVVDAIPTTSAALFHDGETVIETSIQMPGNPNTIVYEEASIQFIQVVALDPCAVLDRKAYQAFVNFAEVMPGNAVRMSTVPRLTLSQNAADSALITQIKAQLDTLLDAYELTTSNTVGDLTVCLVESSLSEVDAVPNALRHQAAQRLGLAKKSLLTKAEYIEKSSLAAWKQFQNLEKKRRDFVAEAVAPLEQIIQAMGALAFRRIEFEISSNSLDSGADLRRFVHKAKQAHLAGKILANPEQLEKIRVALTRIGDNADLFEKATEGIVFQWRGNLRKLTGMFTPINRLRSFFEYGNEPAKISEMADKGGFKDAQGQCLTVSIDKEAVPATLEHFSTHVLKPLGVFDYRPIGSTGKKSRSGDLDIVISVPDDKDALLAGIQQIVGRDNARKLGSILTVAYPVEGVSDNRVQIDIMMSSDISGTEWLMAGHDETKIKGAYRNLMLSLIASQMSKESEASPVPLKITLSFPGGLQIRQKGTSGGSRITSPRRILTELGIKAEPNEIRTFEELVRYMASDNKLRAYLPKFSAYAGFMIKRNPVATQRAISHVENVLS